MNLYREKTAPRKWLWWLEHEEHRVGFETFEELREAFGGFLKITNSKKITVINQEAFEQKLFELSVFSE